MNDLSGHYVEVTTPTGYVVYDVAVTPPMGYDIITTSGYVNTELT